MKLLTIGILTYHRSHNYGAYLQSYALSHQLNSLNGVDCHIINYNLRKEEKSYRKDWLKRPYYLGYYLQQAQMFASVASSQLVEPVNPLIGNMYEKVLSQADEECDIIIIGSDETWHIGTRGFPNIYWLPGHLTCRKMSYAASSRNTPQRLQKYPLYSQSHYYDDFDYLGVRDTSTYQEVKSLCPEKEVHFNCDASFFYKEYASPVGLKERVYEKYHFDPHKKLIVIIYDRQNIIQALRKRIGDRYQFVALSKPLFLADKNLMGITPFEWVDVIGAADFVVSSYFHGMLFSINQNTPFIAIDRRYDANTFQYSKLYLFLKSENLLDNYYVSTEIDDQKLDEIASTIEHCSFVDYQPIVNHQRNLSASFFNYIQHLAHQKELSSR